jgi:hypothetical protein
VTAAPERPAWIVKSLAGVCGQQDKFELRFEVEGTSPADSSCSPYSLEYSFVKN